MKSTKTLMILSVVLGLMVCLAGIDLGLFADEWLHYCPDGWQLK